MATQTQTAKPEDNKPAKKAKVLRVRTAKSTPSFHRAGFAFSPEPRDLVLAELAEDQVKAIQNEPMLFSEVVEA